VQASAAGAAAGSSSSAAAVGPRIWLRYEASGVPVDVDFAPEKTVSSLAKDAIRELDELRRLGVLSNAIAAFEATAADDDDMTITNIGKKSLAPGSRLADLIRSDGKDMHFVFKLRDPPPAATGGAGTSSGERRAAPWALAPAIVRIALQQLYPCLPAHVAGASGAASAASRAPASGEWRGVAPAMAS